MIISLAHFLLKSRKANGEKWRGFYFSGTSLKKSRNLAIFINWSILFGHYSIINQTLSGGKAGKIIKKHFISFSVLILFTSVVFAEDITITIYYPSPYGSYSELTATGNAYLAATSGTVGIGTAGPFEKLHVADGSLFLGPDFYDGAYGRAIKIGWEGDVDVYHSIQTTIS
jgi:hypothetical protein